jgi:hypothetical protein
MSRRLTAWVAVSSVLLVFTITSIARADDDGVKPPAGTHERASASFQEGRRLIEQGNCEAAVLKLRESLQQESSIGARFSIADCVEKTEPLEAWRVLKEAASLALFNHDERLSVAEARAAGLASRLAMITFRLPRGAERSDFELRVDGEIVDRYLYRSGIAATPGKHVVAASARGRRFEKSVAADVGVDAAVDVELRVDECKDASAVTSASAVGGMEIDRGSTRRALGLAIGSAGILGVATGVVFGILTVDKKHAIEAACGGSLGNCAAAPGSVDAENESAKTTAALSTVSLIVGGAALLGGATIYVTAPSGMRLGPRAALIRQGAGLGLGGTW